jgi:hypothetical protein
LIVAELIARRGEGPLARKSFRQRAEAAVPVRRDDARDDEARDQAPEREPR